jgi:hypothetical protein
MRTGPETIGYAQFSDATLQPRMNNYMQEATFELELRNHRCPVSERFCAVGGLPDIAD